MQADAITHQKGTITDGNPVILPLVLGAPYLLICGLDTDNFNSQTITPELFTGVNGGAASQGTLTVDTQPTAGDTFTIGTKVFTFRAVGDANADGDVEVGADLAGAQANIVAAVNGTDRFNDPHPSVTIAAFAADDAVITAIVEGTAGNAIATTETFTAGTNVFDAAVLGTTTAGTDDYSGETAALPTIGSTDSDGSPIAFAAEGMVYFDAGLPNLILQPSAAVTSVRYFLTKVDTFRGLNVGR
jgi:hypothetical protein